MIPRISSRLTGSGGLGSEKERIDDQSICFQRIVSQQCPLSQLWINLSLYKLSNLPARVRFGSVRFALQPSKSSQQATKKSSLFVEA